MVLRVREVTAEERAKLERVVRATTAPVRLVERARIVLAALEGLTAPQIGTRVGVGEATARQWITRFNDGGLAGWTPRHARGGRRPTARRSRAGSSPRPAACRRSRRALRCHLPATGRSTGCRRSSTRTACRSSAVGSGGS